ncbi:hypothetical protein FRB93_001056 [Tulasnella sp. JGI-2019a]|nr:hypothetical protein FRB93_001056 [Tulasnella sp. JGI-2019a]
MVGGLDSFKLMLELDGFELLDDSTVESVVQNGDIIDISIQKQSEYAVPLKGKRKTPESVAQEQPEARPKKKAKSTTVVRPSLPSPLHLIASSHGPPDQPVRSFKPATTPTSKAKSMNSDSDSDSDSSSSSSSDSDLDEESSSSEGSSSSSSSGSSSSLSSSASSSSDSAPSIKGSKQATKSKTVNKKQIIPQRSHATHQNTPGTAVKDRPQAKPPVPPGQGKHSTQERNRRRRLARQHQRIAGGAAPIEVDEVDTDTPTVASLIAPVVAQDEHEPLHDTTATIIKNNFPQIQRDISGRGGERAGELMMTSLKNSNKRKGFKERQAGRKPERIVFADGAPAPLDLGAPSTPTLSRSQSRNNLQLPRLVPPSERTDLPHNLLVTSVDVEADLWNENGKRKGAKGTPKSGSKARHDSNQHQNNRNGMTSSKQGYLDPTRYYISGGGSGSAGYVDEDITLDYGEDEQQVALALANLATSTNGHSWATIAVAGDVANWSAIEKSWSKLPLVVEPKVKLRPGVRVGWQALGIDAATLTPQMVLYLAQVLATSEDLGTVTVKMLRRPGVDDFGFGLRVERDQDQDHDDGDGGEEEIEVQDEGTFDTLTIEEEASFSFADTKEWRIVA